MRATPLRSRAAAPAPRSSLVGLLILGAACCACSSAPSRAPSSAPESASEAPQTERTAVARRDGGEPSAPTSAPDSAAAHAATGAALPPATRPAGPADQWLRRGLDVSAYSGTIDWDAVAAEGHDFAIVKATEGVDLVDPAFHAHWDGAAAAGLVRGAYHFYVTEDDPEKQARFFLDTVDFAPGDLAPIVDVELIGHHTPEGWTKNLRRFAEIVEHETGARPIVYTSPDFWDEHVAEDFGDHPLWVAEYGVDAPRLPSGWDRWHLWQWQGDATVGGIEKTADLSRAADPLHDAHRLFIGP